MPGGVRIYGDVRHTALPRSEARSVKEAASLSPREQRAEAGSVMIASLRQSCIRCSNRRSDMNKDSARLTDKELAGVSAGATDIVMPTATIIVMPPAKIVVKKPIKH